MFQRLEEEKILTTIELTFDKPVYPVKPLQRVPSLTKTATLTCSDTTSDIEALRDQNVHTLWEGYLNKGEKEILIEAAWDSPQTIGSFSIARGEEWVPKNEVHIEIHDGSNGWKDVTPKGFKLKWETMKFFDKPLTTDRIRLRISKVKKFLIAEYELFPPVK